MSEQTVLDKVKHATFKGLLSGVLFTGYSMWKVGNGSEEYFSSNAFKTLLS